MPCKRLKPWRLGNALHILAVKAVVYYAQGDPEQARATLEHTFELAEPEGYVWAFADEGVPMARLLRRKQTHSSASEYVRRLLEALGSSLLFLDDPVADKVNVV